MRDYHIPVMSGEAVEYLNIQPGKWYIDANLGGGGHTQAILQSGGRVLGVDVDPEAVTASAARFSLSLEQTDGRLTGRSDNLIIVQDNFINLSQLVDKMEIGKVKGVLFDLGVSTHQLETPERGFSFNQSGELDMRMDQQNGIKALDLINGLHEKELAEAFWRLGEERFSRPIAKKIVEARKLKPVATTDELARIVLSVRKKSPSDRTHPATRVFQALRIAVNDELNTLQAALPQAYDVLDLRGRLVVISFHSLEDRIVKHFFLEASRDGKGKILTPKPVNPTSEEVGLNPRSRSAKLRCIEKLA